MPKLQIFIVDGKFRCLTVEQAAALGVDKPVAQVYPLY